MFWWSRDRHNSERQRRWGCVIGEGHLSVFSGLCLLCVFPLNKGFKDLSHSLCKALWLTLSYTNNLFTARSLHFSVTVAHWCWSLTMLGHLSDLQSGTRKRRVLSFAQVFDCEMFDSPQLSQISSEMEHETGNVEPSHWKETRARKTALTKLCWWLEEDFQTKEYNQEYK